MGTTTPAAKFEIVNGSIYASATSKATVGISGDYGVFGAIEAFAVGNAGSKLPLTLNAYGGNVGIGTTTPAATLDVAGVIRGTVFTTQYVTVYAGNSTNTFTLIVPYPATYLFTVTGNGAYVGGGGDNYAKAIIYIHIGSSGVLLTTVVQAQGVAINSYTPGTQTLSYNIGTGGLPLQYGGNSTVSIIRLG